MQRVAAARTTSQIFLILYRACSCVSHPRIIASDLRTLISPPGWTRAIVFMVHGFVFFFLSEIQTVLALCQNDHFPRISWWKIVATRFIVKLTHPRMKDSRVFRYYVVLKIVSLPGTARKHLHMLLCNHNS